MASSSNIPDPLGYQESLEGSLYPCPGSENELPRFTVIMNILRSLLKFSLRWHIDDENVQVRLKEIADAIHKVIQDCQQQGSNSTQISGDEDWKSSGLNRELMLSNLMRLKVIKPDLQELCSIVAVKTLRRVDTFRSIRTKNMFPGRKTFPRSIMSSLLNFPILTGKGIGSMASNVVRFADCLVDSLKDVLSHKADLITPIEDQIEALEDKFRFLRNFLLFTTIRRIRQRKLNDLWIYAENVAVHVARLLYFCLVDDSIHENMLQEMRIELVNFVEKINPLNPEARQVYLGALKNLRPSHGDTPVTDEQYLAFVDSLIDSLRGKCINHAVSLFAAENPMETLLDELKLLRFSLLDPAFHEYSRKARSLIVRIKAVMNKTAYSFYFFSISEMSGGMAGQLNLVLSGILEEIERIKGKATGSYDKIIKKSWRSKFPRTNELGFIEFLMKKMQAQLHHDKALFGPLKRQVDVAYEELESFRKDISEMAEQLNHKKELNVLLEDFKDIAYQAEYVVDSIVAQEGSCWSHNLGLFNVMKEIMLVRRKLKELRKKETSGTTAPVLSQANFPNIEVEPDFENEVGQKTEETAIRLVGFEVAAEKITEQLTRGSKQLSILSIVGMPGIGKTTLANSLYKDHSVSFTFHARGWSCVSQEYQKKTLLLELLCQITGKFNRSLETGDKDCVEMLYKSLKGKRYLIVVDDIWDIQAWNDLKEIFPDDHNGSRILLTTRNHDVALKAGSVPYALSPLSDEQSWKLLRMKVFEERSVPSELLQVGKRIAKVCRGLPLAVVSVAGILKKIERSQDRWEKFAESLYSKEITNPLGKCHGILELCYKHLPSHLKSCFLYFGAFPEDAVIPVSKLLWLWIAEGFIHQPNFSQTGLEIEAENYLNELIDRSLVMAAQTSSKGGVKSCRLHDLLRDFCLAKAREENFLLHMRRYDELSSDLVDSLVHQAYRLRIYSSKFVAPRGPLRARSLLSWRFWYFDDVRLVNSVLQFRLLRVLDLSYINAVDGIDYQDFIKITNLVHLRFLAMPVRWPWIPSQIQSLKNLETLIITQKSRHSFAIELPTTIWKLVNLRHLYVKFGYFTLLPHGDSFFDNSSWLENLDSISTVEFFRGNYFEKLTSRTPNLRKLSCLVKFLWDPFIIHLNQVEALKIHFVFEVKYPLQFNSPSNLKKLTLSNLRRPWDEISVIGELPNLEVLKLNEGAYVGRQWDMTEGEFQKLKFLKLSKLDIEVWNASSEHLPCLERLVLHSCLSLEEIPSSALAEISTLQSMEIKECSSSVKRSAKQILDEQREMGNDEFTFSVFNQ